MKVLMTREGMKCKAKQHAVPDYILNNLFSEYYGDCIITSCQKCPVMLKLSRPRGNKELEFNQYYMEEHKPDNN